MTQTDAPQSGAYDDLPNDLPPVKPPSAGFIVQLFVFPALIVLVVVGIWVLFGQIAASEQNWQSIIQELDSPNIHSRRRAMYGLSQLLDNDRRRGAAGLNLGRNSQITQALVGQLTKELSAGTTGEDRVSQQVFLTRSLAYLEETDTVVPALCRAMGPEFEFEVRKSAAATIALIAGRALEQGAVLSNSEAANTLTTLSQDSQPLIRQTAAFALGLFDPKLVRDKLVHLLDDGDSLTALNAAIALARQKSTLGYDVFVRSLKSGLEAIPDTDVERKIEQQTVLRNVLRAASELSTLRSSEQLSALQSLVQPLASDHSEIKTRIAAQTALSELKKAAK